MTTIELLVWESRKTAEADNALARAIFFAKWGEFHERDLQDQIQRASVLNILMNAITVWNTVYLSKAIEYLRERNKWT